MDIHSITTGSFLETCYIISDNANALVVDPGDDAGNILDYLKRRSLSVSGYICTHAHADHISALADLHKERPAPIAIHSKDLSWAFEEQNQILPYYPVPKKPSGATFLALEESTEWELGGMKFQCIETPGHSPGSCCLLFHDASSLIAGDTLFKGSCGRTDLPGGDPRQLKESLNRLKQLPNDIQVFPGHGPSTTIGVERRTNFYMA
ncbi:MAG: MBL fold metallo-hydrolase [Pontiellaceae bacterium]|nr:MBL fold metallo-hydrolase [Pontiellaceae bacterium]MBN2785306.1 MBL fold metallo-hydrolase [Pontiellaceae bacterium]